MTERQTDTGKRVSPEEMQRQRQFCDMVAEYVRAQSQREGRPFLAYIVTYGCQQNEDDSEKLMGMLVEMGFAPADVREQADVILVNTCTIRDHAERKALGNIGALKNLKRANPRLKIGVCGCMVQQPHIPEEMQSKFLHVDFMFGPHDIYRFPEILYKSYFGAERASYVQQSQGRIAEGLPQYRRQTAAAYVTIMSGCNNFCSYCIVPYVRGRERSRDPQAVLAEVRQLVEAGYKDITLLGQNVNSYGKDLDEPMDFADLLRAASEIPGDFLLRFMTSHPKDASQKLFDTMASSPKIAPCFHLPFQAGNDRILKAMNRVYDRAGYLDKVRRLRQAIPDVVITSDVIVGFPGETAEEFEDTMTLIDEVRFDALFTFIFSPREGTPAAKMDDPIPKAEKAVHFQRLVERQDQISEEKHAAYIGRTVRCLVDGRDGKGLTARTPGNRLVRLTGDEGLIGQFVDVKITGANKWSLSGEPA